MWLSTALLKGVSVEDVCAAGSWSSPSPVVHLYIFDMSRGSLQLFVGVLVPFYSSDVGLSLGAVTICNVVRNVVRNVVLRLSLSLSGWCPSMDTETRSEWLFLLCLRFESSVSNILCPRPPCPPLPCPLLPYPPLPLSLIQCV